MSASGPYVSVGTPVYNGAGFLAECIESILSQDYPFAEYVIVNNRSTDGSGELAESYARRDPRLRVIHNTSFVGVAENYNNVFRAIAPASQYCKILSADDRLLPGALRRFVDFAVAHPAAGIIGSYQQSRDDVRWQGLPRDRGIFSGREVCRLGLLHDIHSFGTPTSLLYRSDLVRRRPGFFPHSEPHCDTSACYASLVDCDFGFIHEVLSTERVHEQQVSSRVRRLGADYFAYLDILMQYGPRYLDPGELDSRRAELLGRYYRALGTGVLKLKRRDFWSYHREHLAAIGDRMSWPRILLEAAGELLREVRNPVAAARKFKTAMAER